MPSADIEDLILRTVERWWAQRYSERHAYVTSYDSKKHLAKVTFMPEGQESGWLPIETGHIGNGYGIAVGLTPGSGKPGGGASGSGTGGAAGDSGGGAGDSGAGGGSQSGGDQGPGDQVIVRFHEGDFETGKIVQRVHSDEQKPPEVQSGEMVMWTKWGQQIFFHKDGSLSFKTGEMPQGSQQGQSGGAGGGSSTGSGGVGGQPALASSQQVKKTSIVMDSQGNITTTVDNDHSTTAKHDINATATNKIADKSTGGSSYTSEKNVAVTADKTLNLDGGPLVYNQGKPTVPPFQIASGGAES